MDTANIDTNLRPSTEIRNINTQDGAVLLDIHQGLCFSMNPVAAKIWDMLRANHSVDYIADVIAEEFSVPREQVLGDVREFLAQLQNQHLLVSNREEKKRKTGLLQRLFHRIRASR